jgi:hypothetical protein|tara:strand:- start:1170 stop:2231 length:1062 start_codon:yes stop_codon:yes gene_type:complete
MNTIWIIPIEPIDQRYTKQWYDNIPLTLKATIAERGLNYFVQTVDGEDFKPDVRTEGAFLDFGATNVYKATQAAEVSRLFSNGKVKAGDKFLITDAWNFIITPIKYMSDLLDIPVEIHSIWHAGAYDPTDILGYKMSKPWPSHAEKSWYYSSDYNYYATDFHKNMFLRNLEIPLEDQTRAVRSGQPHELIVGQLVKHQSTPKKRRIMWPHRWNDDKQPEIALGLAQDFDMVITQKMNLDKAEYYATMGESMAIFSCALHENLGISVMEAVLAGAIPIVPDRASYSEMYLPEFKYPTEWTSSMENYKKHKDSLVGFITEKLNMADKYQDVLAKQRDILIRDYLNANVMIDNILK